MEAAAAISRVRGQSAARWREGEDGETVMHLTLAYHRAEKGRLITSERAIPYYHLLY
jgi:hypothetical protein